LVKGDIDYGGIEAGIPIYKNLVFGGNHCHLRWAGTREDWYQHRVWGWLVRCGTRSSRSTGQADQSNEYEDGKDQARVAREL